MDAVPVGCVHLGFIGFPCLCRSVLFRIALQRFHEALQLLIGVRVGILSAAVAVFAALDALGTEVLQGQHLFLGVTDLAQNVRRGENGTRVWTAV